MKYKYYHIKGTERNTKRRVYLITKEEKETMFDTFVLRVTTDGHKVYRSVETDKHYILIG